MTSGPGRNAGDLASRTAVGPEGDLGGPAIRCLSCRSVIRSRHRHDWVQCACRRIFIDGGSDYTRIGTETRDASWEYVEAKENSSDRPQSETADRRDDNGPGPGAPPDKERR